MAADFFECWQQILRRICCNSKQAAAELTEVIAMVLDAERLPDLLVL
ncbi:MULTISPECIES: hypothetical protein [unclassified Bradyrhizobium]|nr:MULTISPECIES: hypothetical protein [unclassified Bradyrhizobium]